MKNDVKEARFPGFSAECCIEEEHGKYGYVTNQANSPEGVSVATFCWDPIRHAWYFC